MIPEVGGGGGGRGLGLGCPEEKGVLKGPKPPI